MPTLVIVRLTDQQRLDAWREGLRRIHESGKSGRDHARSQDREMPERERHEYVGCLAEAAVAQHLGIPWSPTINTFKTIPDAGSYDVRATLVPKGRLIIRNDDPLDRGFVFVTTDPYRGAPLQLHGWLWAREGRRKEWIADPHDKRPSWFVPREALRPMDTLPWRALEGSTNGR